MANIIGKMEDLQKSVQAATLDKINEARGEALQQAQKIKDAAQANAETILAKNKKQAQSEAEQQREQIMADARHQTIQTQLDAREKVLEQVWQDAEKKLREVVESSSYEQVLKQLALLAIQTIGSGQIQLAADPIGHKLLTESKLKHWSTEATKSSGKEVTFTKVDQPLDTWGGLIATNQSAKKRLDARFPQRLKFAEDELRDAIFAELTGKS
jgi:V/A-type H+/Na+-transporting ATPase subunit E